MPANLYWMSTRVAMMRHRYRLRAHDPLCRKLKSLIQIELLRIRAEAAHPPTRNGPPRCIPDFSSCPPEMFVLLVEFGTV